VLAGGKKGKGTFSFSAYDNLDRLTKETVDEGGDGSIDESTAYTFDLAGNCLTMTKVSPGQTEMVTYRCDDHGDDRLTGETATLGRRHGIHEVPRSGYRRGWGLFKQGGLR
jgi:hypothetical protein